MRKEILGIHGYETDEDTGVIRVKACVITRPNCIERFFGRKETENLETYARAPHSGWYVIRSLSEEKVSHELSDLLTEHITRQRIQKGLTAMAHAFYVKHVAKLAADAAAQTGAAETHT